MTSQSDRIQSLVEQINSILSDSPASDSTMASEYQVLEQTRQQLTQLQQGATNTQSSPQATPDGSQLVVNDWQTPAPALAESAQQVLQSIVQEMAYLRMNTVQPLREEVTRLQQERSYLATEVQQLQQQRQQLILAQQADQQQMINGFLHALMGRLQEQLTQQVAQTMVSLSGDTTVPLVSASNEQVVQLDSTLKVLFDSLQASVDTYQDSLEHSLRKMHGLGQQGEAMFTAFVNRLAGQLGREASLHLRPASPTDLELPTEEVTASLGEGIAEDSELTSSIPEDEIAPDYLDHLLEQTLQESVEEIANPQPSKLSNDSESSTPSQASNPQSFVNTGAFTPEPEPNPVANDMLDQIIGQLESNTIDAVEAIDNLDLGFGLEELELADAPISLTADDVSDDAVRELELEVLSQLSQDPISPINLPSGLDLDAPLDLAANIRMDEDESDVERFMDALNQPQDDQPIAFEPGLMGLEDTEQAISNHPLLSDRLSSDLSIMGSSNEGVEGLQSLDNVQGSAAASSTRMDGGIADVSPLELQMDDTVRDSDDDSAFLLQQLSSELYDDVLGEDFLDEPSASGGDRPANQRASSDSGISFLINASAESFVQTNEDNGDSKNIARPNPTSENNRSQDFYASFTVDTPSGPFNSPEAPAPNTVSETTTDSLSGFNTSQSDSNNTWSEWNNNLDNDLGTDLDAIGVSIPPLEATASAPVVDTIHSLRDLIESTGIASKPPVSFPDSDSTNSEGNDEGAKTTYRSPSLEVFTDLNTESLGEANDLNNEALDWREWDDPALAGNDIVGSDPSSSLIVDNSLDDQAQREAELLAGLDLRLDATTMRELANDLSEMDDSASDLYGETDNLDALGSDIANSVPLPPPLISDIPTTTDADRPELDNPEDNAIETLQGLFSNGEAKEGTSQSNQGNGTSINVSNDDETAKGTNENDLTPVSWTLEDLISHDLSPSASSTDADPPINDPSSPTQAELNADFSSEFEDDDLVNLMNNLQSEPDTSPLSGVEEAKTLADLLRSQNSVPSQSSSDTSESTSPFADLFGDETDEPDDLSDQEKKNNH